MENSNLLSSQYKNQKECPFCRTLVSIGNFELHTANCERASKSTSQVDKKIEEQQINRVQQSRIFQDVPQSNISNNNLNISNAQRSQINNPPQSQISQSNVNQSIIKSRMNINPSSINNNYINNPGILNNSQRNPPNNPINQNGANSVYIHPLPRDPVQSEILQTVKCPYCNKQLKFIEIENHYNQCIANQIPCEQCNQLFPQNIFSDHIQVCQNNQSSRASSSSSRIRSSQSSRINERPSTAVTTQEIRNGNQVQILYKDANGRVVDHFQYDDDEDDYENDNDDQQQSEPDNSHHVYHNTRSQVNSGGPRGFPPNDPFTFINHIMGQFGGLGNLNMGINNRSGHGGIINRNDGFIQNNPGMGGMPGSNGRIPLEQLLAMFHTGILNRDPSNNGGLSGEERKDFVSFEYKKPVRQPDEGQKNSEEDNKCVICISQFEQGENIQALDCMHKFHSGCIDEWLKKNTLCPICKKDMKDFVRGNN